MNQIKKYCLSLPEAVEDYPFGPTPCVIKVNQKIFVLINNDTELSLKCDPMWGQMYREMFEGVRPGYHLNKKHWNTITLGKDVEYEMVKKMIRDSYRAVVKGFSKQVRERYLMLMDEEKE